MEAACITNEYIGGKAERNKKLKENALYNAAYELFTKNDFSNTAISDIVKKAGVAKGTFYLYFKDKYDILDRLILKKSTAVLKEALEATEEQSHKDFIDMMIYFIDYIIEYFKGNHILLKLVYKNLSWGLYRKALESPRHNSELQVIFEVFRQNVGKYGYSAEEIEKVLFMILELTGSVCYSSIILQEPAPIDEMKPMLFKMIKKMLI